MSASVSTTAPRDVLIRIAPCFIWASRLGIHEMVGSLVQRDMKADGMALGKHVFQRPVAESPTPPPPPRFS